MTRDVLRKPRFPSISPKRRRWSVWLWIGLVSINIAVFLYHGDPRSLLDELLVKSDIKVTPKAVVRNEVPALLASAASDGAGVLVSEAKHPTKKETTGRQDILVKHGQTPAGALLAAGLETTDVHAALASLASMVNFRQIRPGTRLSVWRDVRGQLTSVETYLDILERYRTYRNVDGSWHAERVDVPVVTVTAVVGGVVQSSLWQSLVDIGESPRLVYELVDIFAWDIDFYSEVYRGDTFKLLVEKKYVDGQLAGYGDIYAAQIRTGHRMHQAFRHVDANGRVGYYDTKGRSLRKQLLRAPLKYAPVTSGFGRRRHPVLGFTRQHNGVDYGVPTGTKVWSVGDGRVIRAGWHGGFGKLVEIRHANGWMSQYAHLSKIYVRVGQKVYQKEIVAAVGSTGLSTGPHLHFGLKHRGKYVNPVKSSFAPGKPLKGEELAILQQDLVQWSQRLDGWVVASGRSGGV